MDLIGTCIWGLVAILSLIAAIRSFICSNRELHEPNSNILALDVFGVFWTLIFATSCALAIRAYAIGIYATTN